MMKHRRMRCSGVAAHDGLHHRIMLGERSRRPAFEVELRTAKWRESAPKRERHIGNHRIMRAGIDQVLKLVVRVREGNAVVLPPDRKSVVWGKRGSVGVKIRG